MKKDIVYLVQTPDYIPPFVPELEARGRDVIILSYRKPLKYKKNIFMEVFGLVWLPYYVFKDAGGWVTVPAFSWGEA